MDTQSNKFIVDPETFLKQPPKLVVSPEDFLSGKWKQPETPVQTPTKVQPIVQRAPIQIQVPPEQHKVPDIQIQNVPTDPFYKLKGIPLLPNSPKPTQQPPVKQPEILNIPEDPFKPNPRWLKPENAKPPERIAVHSTIENILDKVSPLLEPEHKTGNTVVVSIPDKMVYIRNTKGEDVAQFKAYVGTSKDPTPRGQFRIMEGLEPNSEWFYGPGFMTYAKNPYPGQSNAYYGFHGWKYTKDDDDEEKVNPGWKTSTHGCVQLDNSDMAKFAKLVGPGDNVSIIEHPLNPAPVPAPIPEGLKK